MYIWNDREIIIDRDRPAMEIFHILDSPLEYLTANPITINLPKDIIDLLAEFSLLNPNLHKTEYFSRLKVFGVYCKDNSKEALFLRYLRTAIDTVIEIDYPDIKKDSLRFNIFKEKIRSSYNEILKEIFPDNESLRLR